MSKQDGCADPGGILAHASAYLWKQWRHYPLAAWEDAESILRRAHNAIEKKDWVKFVHSLDGQGDSSDPQFATPNNATVAKLAGE